MTRFASFTLLLAACSGGHGSTLPPDSATPMPDASPAPRSGDLLDAAIGPRTFYGMLSVDRGLVQLDDGVHAGLTGPLVASGAALRGELHGNLVVTTLPPNQQVATPPVFCRYDVTTGQRDPSFGTNGCASAPRAYFSARGIVQVPDGYRAIVQEDCSNGCPSAEESFGLIKLSADGVVDPSFGTEGIQFSTVLPQISALAFAAQSSGDLVVNGYVGLYDMRLFRIHPDGSLDTSFGSGGFVPDANGGAVRVLADDTILVESSYNGIERIDRYTADGQPLPGFGVAGSADLAGLTNSTFDNELDEKAADLDANGRIVVGYSRRDSDGAPERMFVLRLTPAGALDTSFGTGGIVSNLGTEPLTWIYGIGFEHDGRIVFGGSSAHGQVIGHLQP